MALIIPGLDVAQTRTLGAVTVDYKVGQINAASFPVLDRKTDGERLGAVAAAIPAGTWVTVDGVPWLIVSQTRAYRADGLLLTVSAQSGLGARLKMDKGPRGDRGITPGQWITKRAKANGGSAVVQEGAKRRHIVQKRGQSALSVVESLSSDMGTSWVEADNVLYVGTPWWAFEGGPRLPVWSVDRGSAAVHEFEGRDSTADDANSATATMVVPNEVARQFRPWHRVDVSGAARADNGLWLIEGLAYDLHGSPGTVELTRPRRSTVSKGSSSTGGTGSGGDVSIPADGWVPGADRVWPGTNQTPKQMVARALSMRGQSGPAPTRTGRWAGFCATFTSYLANVPYSGGPDLAKNYWYNMLSRGPGTPHGTDHNAPAGAFVVWSGPNSAGHVAISIGGGRMVTTTDGAITEMDVGGYIGWGYYLGWMAPASYR